MTLEEFSRDVVPIAQMLLTLVGLVSVILVWLQLKEATKWNKLNATLNITNLKEIQELDKSVNEALTSLGIDTQRGARALTDSEVTEILDSDEGFFAIKAFLSDLENLATGVNVGAVHYDYSYDLHSSRFFRAINLLEPFILELRRRHKDPNIFLEMEKLAKEWKERSDNEARKTMLSRGARKRA